MNLHRLWVSRAALGALGTPQPPVALPRISGSGSQTESHVQSYPTWEMWGGHEELPRGRGPPAIAQHGPS